MRMRLRRLLPLRTGCRILAKRSGDGRIGLELLSGVVMFVLYIINGNQDDSCGYPEKAD